MRTVDQLADILKACRSPCSRPKLSAATSMSRDTVARWVDALVENGLLVEVEREEPDLNIKGPWKSGTKARQFALAKCWGGKA